MEKVFEKEKGMADIWEGGRKNGDQTYIKQNTERKAYLLYHSLSYNYDKAKLQL